MQQVTAFKTADGLLFESAYAAEVHEKRTNGSPELALVNKFRAAVLEKLNLKTGWGRNELKDILADTYTIVMGESPGTAEDDPIV